MFQTQAIFIGQIPVLHSHYLVDAKVLWQIGEAVSRHFEGENISQPTQPYMAEQDSISALQKSL